jgi:hypothetical protein
MSTNTNLNSSSNTNVVNSIQIYANNLVNQTTVNTALTNPPRLKTKPASVVTAAAVGAVVIPLSTQTQIISSTVLTVTAASTPPPPPPVIGAPTNLLISGGYINNYIATITFTDNVTNTTVTGYNVAFNTDNSVFTFSAYTGTFTPGSITLNNLFFRTYYLKIQTITTAGVSPASSTFYFTSFPVISPPTNLLLSSGYANVSTSTITFTDNLFATTISGYQYLVSQIPITSSMLFLPYTGTFTPGSITLNSLTAPPYYIQIKTLTPVGVGPASDTFVIPKILPPTILSSSTVKGITTITFTDNISGPSITGYQYAISTSPLTSPTFVPYTGSLIFGQIVFTSLQSPSYYLQIKTVTPLATTQASATFTLTVPITTDATANLALGSSGGYISSNGSVTVSFKDLVSGTPVTGYKYAVSSSPGGPFTFVDYTGPLTPGSITLTGLSNSTQYVQIQTLISSGVTSPSNTLILPATPTISPPTNLVLTSGYTDVSTSTITFTDNIIGTNITGYQIAISNISPIPSSTPFVNYTGTLTPGTITLNSLDSPPYYIQIKTVTPFAATQASTTLTIPRILPPFIFSSSTVKGITTISFTDNISETTISGYRVAINTNNTTFTFSTYTGTFTPGQILFTSLSSPLYYLQIQTVTPLATSRSSSTFILSIPITTDATTNLTLSSGAYISQNGSATLSFQDLVSGTPVTGYKYAVSSSPNGPFTFVDYTGPLTPGSISLTGLSITTQQYLQIQTVTSTGVTSPSTTLTLPITPVINAPTNLLLISGYADYSTTTIIFTDNILGTTASGYQYAISQTPIISSTPFISYTGTFTPESISINPTGTPPYYLQVKTVTPNGVGPASVTLTLPKILPPSDFSSLTLKGITTITFTDNISQTSVIGYRVAINTDNTTFTFSAYSGTFTPGQISFTSLQSPLYYLKIQTVTPLATSQASSTFTLSVPITTDATANLALASSGVNLTNGSATISFQDLVSGTPVTGYKYAVSSSPGGPFTFIDYTGPLTPGSINITGLSNSTQYLQIQTVTSSGVTSSSSTLILPPTINPPTNLVLSSGYTNISTAIITFTDNIIGTNISGYEVAISQTPNPTSFSLYTGAFTPGTITLNSLTAPPYYIQIKTVTPFNTTLASATLSIPKIFAPTNISSSTVKAITTVTFTDNIDGATVTGYRVAINTDNTTFTFSAYSGTFTPGQISFTSLSSPLYYLQIQTVTTLATSPSSTTFTLSVPITTDSTANLALSSGAFISSNGSATISFQDLVSGTTPTGYKYAVSSSPSGPFTFVDYTGPLTPGSITLSGLGNSTKYLQIQTVTSAGVSTPSNTLTLPAIPVINAPTNLSFRFTTNPGSPPLQDTFTEVMFSDNLENFNTIIRYRYAISININGPFNFINFPGPLVRGVVYVSHSNNSSYIQVQAVTAFGLSPPSISLFLPKILPPTILSSLTDKGVTTVTFTDNIDGTTVTGYSVAITTIDNNFTFSTYTGTFIPGQISFTSLSEPLYYLRIKTITALETSGTSLTFTLSVPITYDTTTTLAISSNGGYRTSDGTATISFQDRVSGTPVIGYQYAVSRFPNGPFTFLDYTGPLTPGSINLTGLPNLTRYLQIKTILQTPTGTIITDPSNTLTLPPPPTINAPINLALITNDGYLTNSPTSSNIVTFQDFLIGVSATAYNVAFSPNPNGPFVFQRWPLTFTPGSLTFSISYVPQYIKIQTVTPVGVSQGSEPLFLSPTPIVNAPTNLAILSDGGFLNSMNPIIGFTDNIQFTKATGYFYAVALTIDGPFDFSGNTSTSVITANTDSFTSGINELSSVSITLENIGYPRLTQPPPYYLQLRTFTQAGISPPSDILILEPPPTLLAPSNLVVTTGGGFLNTYTSGYSTNATITFTDNVVNLNTITGYRYAISTRISGPYTFSQYTGPFIQGSITLTIGPPYTLTPPPYYLQIQTVSSTGRSPGSIALILQPQTISAPTNLIATLDSESTYVTVTFTDNVGGATVIGYQYSVQIALEGSNFQSVYFVQYTGTLIPGSITLRVYGGQNLNIQVKTVIASGQASLPSSSVNIFVPYSQGNVS